MATREIVALNEGVPQLQVPGASDTYLMARDMDAGGNDITNLGTVYATTYEGIDLLGQIGLSINNDIIVAFVTGQSVATGITAVTGAGYTANPNMYEWRGTYRSGVNGSGVIDTTWQTWNPNASVQSIYSGQNQLVGSLGGQCSQWTYDALSRLQIKTGKKVFVISVAYGGLSITGWDTPSGAMYVYCRDRLDDALAALQAGTLGAPAAYPAATYCNLFLMSHGENDASEAKNATPAPYDTIGNKRGAWDYYATEYVNLFNALVTDGHLSAVESRCIFCPPCIQGTLIGDLGFTEWRGHEYIAQKLGNHFQVVDTTNVVMYDAAHPSVAGHATIAAEALELILSGTKSNYRPDALRYLQEDEAPVLGGNLNANSKTISNAVIGAATLSGALNAASQTITNAVLATPLLASTLDADGKTILDAVLSNPTLSSNLAGGGFDLLNLGRIENTGGYVGPSRQVNNADITVTLDDYFVLIGGTLSANRTINLPAVSTVLGQVFYIYNISTVGAYKATIDPNSSETFLQHTFQSGSASQIIAQGEMVILYPISAGWMVLSRAASPQFWTYKTATSTLNHHMRNTVVNAAGATTQTLPPVTECYGMGNFTIKNVGAGTVTVEGDGSDPFYGADTTSTLTDTLAAGEVGIYSPSSAIFGSGYTAWMILSTSAA